MTKPTTSNPLRVSSRDFDYIEGRLLAPSIAAGEAYQRLLAVGEGERAERLMLAMQAFQDECRAIRQDLSYLYRRGQTRTEGAPK